MNTKIKIDKDVPLPKPRRKFPIWHSMDDPAHPPPMDGTEVLLSWGVPASRPIVVVGLFKHGEWVDAWEETPVPATRWCRFTPPADNPLAATVNEIVARANADMAAGRFNPADVRYLTPADTQEPT